MMNVLALCLVVTSVATAGVWSPSPEKKNPGEEVIVKEGHRIIVVEYEKQGPGNTKVSISPQETQASHKNEEIDDKSPLTDAKEKLSTAAPPASGVVQNAKEKIKEASSVLPNLGQGLSGSHSPSNGHSPGPRELICDAFGNCKHKITGAFGRAKEKVTEKTHEVGAEAKEAVESVGDSFGKAKETVSQKAHEIETARQKAAEKAREGKEMAETAAEKVKTAAEERKNDLTEIMCRGREVVYDAVTYVVSPHTVGSLMSVFHLMGFAMAYGMSVWITFVSSYILAGALPRQQFGMVQSKIYPVYFRAMAYSIGVALLGHFLSQRKRLFSSKAEMFQGFNHVVSLLMVCANLVYLEPRATKVMFERMKAEKEEGRGKDDYTAEPSRVVEPVSVAKGAAASTTTTPTTAAAPQVSERLDQMVKSRIVRLNERMKKLNSYSSFLNILTLMALTWHLVYLGQRLHMTC